MGNKPSLQAGHKRATAVDPDIHITFISTDGKYNRCIVIRKCSSRQGMLTVFNITDGLDDPSPVVMFEFDRKVEEHDVWSFVSASVMKHMQAYGSVGVANNFMNPFAKVEFSEKTIDDMKEHVKLLVRFMIMSASLHIDPY